MYNLCPNLFMSGFPDLGLLSFNMNILPFGVASMRGHESLHSSARLQTFLQRIRAEVEAETFGVPKARQKHFLMKQRCSGVLFNFICLFGRCMMQHRCNYEF